MVKDRQFDFKKAQIENFIRAEFKKKFSRNARISVRKRQRFMEATTRKIAEKFGKDVLCLVDFTKHGFVSLVSPSHTESTDKGRLFRSFSHPQVYYTSHCLERFSQRTETMENCVISLDAYLSAAMMTYGMFDGYLVCMDGVFAYELEDERLIIKTYINHELLTDTQIEKFYGPETFLCFADDAITGDSGESDFILLDELSLPAGENPGEEEKRAVSPGK